MAWPIETTPHILSTEMLTHIHKGLFMVLAITIASTLPADVTQAQSHISFPRSQEIYLEKFAEPVQDTGIARLVIDTKDRSTLKLELNDKRVVDWMHLRQTTYRFVKATLAPNGDMIVLLFDGQHSIHLLNSVQHLWRESQHRAQVVSTFVLEGASDNIGFAWAPNSRFFAVLKPSHNPRHPGGAFLSIYDARKWKKLRDKFWNGKDYIFLPIQNAEGAKMSWANNSRTISISEPRTSSATSIPVEHSEVITISRMQILGGFLFRRKENP